MGPCRRQLRSLPLADNMDIPSYSSSGALTREHYTLVRNVELAASESDADQYIFAEVQTIRRRIGQSSVSSVRGFLALDAFGAHSTARV